MMSLTGHKFDVDHVLHWMAHDMRAMIDRHASATHHLRLSSRTDYKHTSKYHHSLHSSGQTLILMVPDLGTLGT